MSTRTGRLVDDRPRQLGVSHLDARVADTICTIWMMMNGTKRQRRNITWICSTTGLVDNTRPHTRTFTSSDVVSPTIGIGGQVVVVVAVVLVVVVEVDVVGQSVAFTHLVYGVIEQADARTKFAFWKTHSPCASLNAKEMH